MSKSNDRLARKHDNVSDWNDMSAHGLLGSEVALYTSISYWFSTKGQNYLLMP